jgi:hypothetical protein
VSVPIASKARKASLKESDEVCRRNEAEVIPGACLRPHPSAMSSRVGEIAFDAGAGTDHPHVFACAIADQEGAPLFAVGTDGTQASIDRNQAQQPCGFGRSGDPDDPSYFLNEAGMGPVDRRGGWGPSASSLPTARTSQS